MAASGPDAEISITRIMTVTKTKYTFLNGEIVPDDEAKVHVSTTAFKFGAAVFEGVRGYWNEEHEQLYLFRVHEHMQRLAYSQRVMRFDGIFEADYVTEKLVELIRANELRETLHAVPTVFVNSRGGPETCGPTGLSITVNPGFTRGFVEKGCSVQVSSWQRVPDNAMPVRVKCNANYQNGRLAAVQARADGYDTALLLNSRGKVSEGPGQCFFMIRDGKAITPSASNDILESITRDAIIRLLPHYCGIEVEERDVDRSELPAAEEAFFCGTAWEVTPIVDIDRIAVGTGETGAVVTRLKEAFFRVAKGEGDDYAEWRTPVYEG